MNEKTITVKKEALNDFVKECLLWLPTNKETVVVALSGDLGAGKTTFVKALAAELGVKETVTSPTFTIMNRYETDDDTWTQLLHMDAYRIDELSELGPLRFSELLQQPQSIFCIEWAEKIESALPDNTVWMKFSNTKDEDTRTVQMYGLAVNG